MIATPRKFVASAAVLLLAACTEDEPSVRSADPLDDDTVTVGSFDFPESVLLAELYSQALEDGGVPVRRAFGLGPREFVGPALSAGLIEVVPEYAGTAVTFFSAGAVSPSPLPERAHRQLVEVLEGRSIAVLDPAPAQNSNTFVVTGETARRYQLSELSDLATVSHELVLGGPPECPTRLLCQLGLRTRYGLSFDDFVMLDTGGSATHQALRNGGVDIALLFRTDPALSDYVELTDDRHLQPAENVTPLVRREVIESLGADVVELLDATSRQLDTDTLRELNAADADTPGIDDVPSIVAAWRIAEGLT